MAGAEPLPVTSAESPEEALAEPLDPDVVLAAMKKAAAFAHSRLAREGGYASSWDAQGKLGKTEHLESPTAISIQPPGTTTVGLAMLRAFQATGDGLFLDAARDAAGALLRTQLASGGWDKAYDFDPERRRNHHLRSHFEAGDREPGKRRTHSTLDDNTTQSALLFLLEMAHEPALADDAELQRRTRFGLDALLAAQAPNGGWSQTFDGPADPSAPVVKAGYPNEWSRVWPAVPHAGHSTINDGNLKHIARLLVRAHELGEDPRFLVALRKLGDFLLLAQMPEPQPVWAQQYDRAMRPAWGRKFEPPAVVSYESLGVLETLHDLWVLTGDEKYRAAIAPALAWFERSRLADGHHARFYELRTNTPLFLVTGSYELTHDDSNLPGHYSFRKDLGRPLDALRRKLSRDRTELRRLHAGPQTPKEWARGAAASVDAARLAVEALDSDGRWLHGDRLEARRIAERLTAMARSIEAVRRSRGGATRLPQAG